MVNFENEMNNSFDRAGISNERREFIINYLNELRDFDEYKFKHSVRVGISVERIANKHLSDCPVCEIVTAAFLHDIGVLDVNLEIVHQANILGGKFTKEDYVEMKKHVLFGHERIREKFPNEARIMLYHHVNTRKYPKLLPGRGVEMVLSELDCHRYGHLIELCDFADSLNRKNERFGKIDKGERREILTENFVDYKDVINWAYMEEVFN